MGPTINKAFKYAAATFFVIAVAVHIHGLIYHPTSESDASHIAHVFSYGLCFMVVLNQFKYAILWFVAGAAYPMYYHVGCALNGNSQFNGVCIFTVVFLLLTAAWLILSLRKKILP